jgi:hypothetical protein
MMGRIGEASGAFVFAAANNAFLVMASTAAKTGPA